MNLTNVDVIALQSYNKINIMRRYPISFFFSSILAGVYISFGVILSNTIAFYSKTSFYSRFLAAFSFPFALTLIVIAGADLFTGNLLNMFLAYFTKKVKINYIAVYLTCNWLFNFFGVFIISYCFKACGFNLELYDFFTSIVLSKMSIPMVNVFFRSILCNMLVCLAIWASNKCKNETAKLIMIFLCVFTFVFLGFEHSIASMALLAITGILEMFPFIVVSTFGNILGAFLGVALPYFFIEKNEVFQYKKTYFRRKRGYYLRKQNQ